MASSRSDESASGAIPVWAKTTTASRARAADDSEVDVKRSASSARSRDKKRPVSADPRYNVEAEAGQPPSPSGSDEEKEAVNSPIRPVSPSASTASHPPSPRRPNLNAFVGCEDPAEFAPLVPKDDLYEEEDWGARGGDRTTNYFHRPSSVSRFRKNDSVAEFVAWVESFPHGWENVHGVFIKESASPSGGEHVHRGHQPMAGLTKKRWVKLLMNMRYPNDDGLGSVFDDIAQESNTEKDRKLTLTELRDGAVESEINLSQFKRFQRRVTCAMGILKPDDKNSPSMRFAAWMRNKYGSVLNAWRSMLDVHGTGRVGQTDFLNGCTRMGMGAQGKLVWHNLRKDKVHPLEFHELDPKEGDTLDVFAKVLYEKVGFNMNKAWTQMDCMNQNYMTLDQFIRGCRAWGWWGDARLLYKGLDSSGLGRLKKEDFKYMCKVSHITQRRFGGTQHSKSALAELVSWCKYEMGGADKLVTLLGFGPHGQPTSTVDELAQRLQKLGFEADADEAAARAVSEPGGSTITTQSLHDVLTCTHHYHSDGLKGISPRSRSHGFWVEHRLPWNGAVDDICHFNKERCTHFRGYFGLDGVQPITMQPKVDQPYAPPLEEIRPDPKWESPIADHNPRWNDVAAEEKSKAPETPPNDKKRRPCPGTITSETPPNDKMMPPHMRRYAGDCSGMNDTARIHDPNFRAQARKSNSSRRASQRSMF